MKENWTIGPHGEILTDTLGELTESAGHISPEYYGEGKGLIAESIYRNKDRHLISASPDLLEVAEETLQIIKHFLRVRLPDKEAVALKTLRKMTCDAINKAKGHKTEEVKINDQDDLLTSIFKVLAITPTEDEKQFVEDRLNGGKTDNSERADAISIYFDKRESNKAIYDLLEKPWNQRR